MASLNPEMFPESPDSPQIYDAASIGGPVRPEFTPERQIEEIYRALEEGTLAWKDAKRMIDEVDAAPTPAKLEDDMLHEFHRGLTSAFPDDPQIGHSPGCNCGRHILRAID